MIYIAATFKFNNDSLRRLLGPMGALKRKIEEETGLIKHGHATGVTIQIIVIVL